MFAISVCIAFAKRLYSVCKAFAKRLYSVCTTISYHLKSSSSMVDDASSNQNVLCARRRSYGSFTPHRRRHIAVEPYCILVQRERSGKGNTPTVF